MTDRRGARSRGARLALWAIVVAIPLGGVAAAIAVEPDATTVWAAVAAGVSGFCAGMLFRRRLRGFVLDDGRGGRRGYAGHVVLVAAGYLVARQLPVAATAALMAAVAGLAVAGATAAEGADKAEP